MSDVRRVRSVKKAIKAAPHETPVDSKKSTKESSLSEADFDDESSAARTIQALLKDAVVAGASVVHIEPHGHKIVTRYRIDGLLRDGADNATIAGELFLPMVARIKLLANLDVLESRVPQDGRFETDVSGKKYVVRASLLPVADGEKIVLHIIDESAAPHDLQNLGYWGRDLRTLQEAVQTARGLVIVGGPAGAGKTSTLYALLHMAYDPGLSASTVEEIIERRIPGVNQSLINRKAGLTYASTLRAVLRQDPNTLMVADIGEPDSAEQIVQAALSGRLVLAGMHTNDVAASLSQLNAMGIAPYLLASTVRAIANQRLVRRLCVDCRESYKPAAGEFEAACSACGLNPIGALSHLAQLERQALAANGEKAGEQVVSGNKITTLWRANPQGCAHCGNTGYKGRAVLTEVAAMSQPMQQLVFSTTAPKAIYDLAIAEGMVPLPMKGFVKAALGETSLAEVIRAVAR